MNHRVLMIVAATAVMAAPVPGQERVVTDDSPLPPRSADKPHPDGVVSADQLVDMRRRTRTRRNVELILGVILVCALLIYALMRQPRSR